MQCLWKVNSVPPFTPKDRCFVYPPPLRFLFLLDGRQGGSPTLAQEGANFGNGDILGAMQKHIEQVRGVGVSLHLSLRARSALFARMPCVYRAHRVPLCASSELSKERHRMLLNHGRTPEVSWPRWVTIDSAPFCRSSKPFVTPVERWRTQSRVLDFVRGLNGVFLPGSPAGAGDREAPGDQAGPILRQPQEDRAEVSARQTGDQPE